MLKIYKGRHGRLAHFDSDTTIGLSIARYGEWGESEIYLLSRHLKRGDTVLDIGANVGTHSLAFSRIVGREGRVIAMDAQHGIFQVLAMNMVMNGRLEVDCLNVLAGSSAGVEMIPATDARKTANFGAASFTAGAREVKKDWRHLPVAMITVDSLGLDQCAAMKVDVEGMEIEVFRGAAATIERCSPLIYFEQTGPKNLDLIWTFFGERGYALYWHVANPYNARNFNGNPHNVFGGTCEINIVAVPHARADLAEHLGVAGDRINAPGYTPPHMDNPVAGWTLPEDAYAGLEPPDSYGPPDGLGDAPEPDASATRQALQQLQRQYDALMEDRQKAQTIMEYQLDQITKMKQEQDAQAAAKAEAGVAVK